MDCTCGYKRTEDAHDKMRYKAQLHTHTHTQIALIAQIRTRWLHAIHRYARYTQSWGGTEKKQPAQLAAVRDTPGQRRTAQDTDSPAKTDSGCRSDGRTPDRSTAAHWPTSSNSPAAAAFYLFVCRRTGDHTEREGDRQPCEDRMTGCSTDRHVDRR